MTEKEKAIIASGMKLFAGKGFSSTSIQEIAAESGISKGAFYLHFKSKDDLLFSILEYIFDTVQSSISSVENLDMPPREKFIKQISAFFGTFIGHKEFLIMLSKEQAIPRNEEIKKLFFKKRFESHLFYRQGMVSIYGKDLEPQSIDLALILEGLFQSYIGLLILDPVEFEIEELSHFLMRRMDSIVKEISFDQPFLTEEKIEKVIKKSEDLFENNNINDIMQKMRKEFEQLELENKEAIEISIEVLEEEINREKPRIPVIKGMLSNFEEIQSFDYFRKAIAAYFGIE